MVADETSRMHCTLPLGLDTKQDPLYMVTTCFNNVPEKLHNDKEQLRYRFVTILNCDGPNMTLFIYI